MKPEVRIGGRVFLTVSSRREAEAAAGVAGLVCQVTKRQLSCRYRGDAATLAASNLPIRNMLDFSGEQLDMPASELADAIRRDALACKRLVRKMAERLRIGWQFRDDADAEPADTRDIVVLARDDHHITTAEVRDALKTARGVLVPAGRKGVIGPGPVVLHVPAHNSGTARDLASRLADALGREAVSLDPGSPALLQRLHPAVIVLDAAGMDSIGDDILNGLLALRCPLLVASNED